MIDSVYHTARCVGCTNLVVVGCGNEYNGTLARNVECAARANFSEEDVGDDSPEDERSVVDEIRVVLVLVCHVHSGAGRS